MSHVSPPMSGALPAGQLRGLGRRAAAHPEGRNEQSVVALHGSPPDDSTDAI